MYIKMNLGIFFILSRMILIPAFKNFSFCLVKVGESWKGYNWISVPKQRFFLDCKLKYLMAAGQNLGGENIIDLYYIHSGSVFHFTFVARHTKYIFINLLGAFHIIVYGYLPWNKSYIDFNFRILVLKWLIQGFK